MFIPCFSSHHQGMEVPKALPQSRHLVSCPVKGSSTGGTPTEWVFSVLCICGFCRMMYFPVTGVQILPPTSLEWLPTAGEHPQTQLGTRYGWPLAHKELLHPLTGFVFNPAGCPYPYTLLTRKPGGGDGLVANKPTMEQVSTGLHGTCSKSQI